jgi:hypothetical protein
MKQKPKFRPRNKLKIVAKGTDKYAECTKFGFVYDSRKIKKEWLK